MKLTKDQIYVLAVEIHKELMEMREKRIDEIEKEFKENGKYETIIDDFGYINTESNSANLAIKKLFPKGFFDKNKTYSFGLPFKEDYNPKAFIKNCIGYMVKHPPNQSMIANKITLYTIECDKLDELINKIKKEYDPNN